MSTDKIATIEINVKCPISFRSVKIPMQYCELNDKKLFLPCAGCDNCHDNKLCYQCRADLTIMFNNGFEVTSTDAITLPFLKP